MNFTPELQFEGADFRGRVRSLSDDDQANLLNLYQHPELPGQRPLDPESEQAQDHIARMIELSVQMAATQRGIMWALEINDEFQGMVSVFDWQPSLLRATLRVDGLAALTNQQRASALAVCMDFMAEKYHLRNFAYQWIQGQDEALLTTLENIGFERSATMREAWKLVNDSGEKSYVDIIQLNRVLDIKESGRKEGEES
ncbi:hypothetical protein [Bacterioplanoides sp. SCSIO 12839]|uniref:hypothetical protein n=1 Tax=Bacterioplanoides sp. SCSIO 12839 TaxID=2829569 RepID=UPI00210752A3|nr:hypothetical protein [Bacterioplanoides sp. SCSIO 12839]UTW48851.1 hypothetical protein KFF03_02780 [Bacterioplanoides sp. SCSIO 12839]